MRSNNQQRRFDQFMSECTQPVTIIEIGAGRTIPTIRWNGETLAKKHGATMIRINPNESQIAEPHISIAAGAATALERINEFLST